jgi:hypothetical protein
VAALIMSLVFVVLLTSPNPDLTLSRALRGNLAVALGPVFPFVVIGTLISPIVIRAMCLWTVVLLAAAGAGLWGRRPWAFRLELILLAVGAACLFGSAAILALFRPAIGLLHFTLASAMTVVAWRMVRPTVSPRRFGIALGAALACGLLVFGAMAAFVVKGLAALR